MHTIIIGKNAEYLPDGLVARPSGHLILKDGTRYTFDVIDMPYSCDPPVRNNNLISVETLAFGAGKWMLGSESFFESLADIQLKAWSQLNRDRAEQSFPPIPWDVFQETVRDSHQLWFPGQSEKEVAIVQKTNSEFFGRLYAQHWGLAQLLRHEGQNAALRCEVCAAAWFDGNHTPLLLRDFSEDNASVRKPSVDFQEEKPEPTEPENVFRPAGEFWQVRFKNGKSVSLKDRHGMRYMHLLIEHRGENYPAVQLGQAIAKSLPDPDHSISVEEPSENPERSQRMIDEPARAAVLDAIAQLNEERETADSQRRDDIDEEIQKCKAYLAGATFKGQVRSFSNAKDAERSKITHAINTAIRAIRDQLPDAAEYLKTHIRTGSTFLYTGDMTWAT